MVVQRATPHHSLLWRTHKIKDKTYVQFFSCGILDYPIKGIESLGILIQIMGY